MVRLTKIIFILLILLVSFQAHSKNPPPGTGTADIPANILIMLDNSGSMTARLNSNTQMYYPLDVDFDSSGNVYVLEYWNNRIKVFDSSGAYLRSLGGYGTTCGTWRYARQFAIYNDQIYIADYYNHRIKRLTLTGVCNGNISSVNSSPHAIAVGPASGGGRIYVGFRSRINIFSATSLALISSVSSSNINFPWGMATNASGTKLIIGDYYKNNLREFSIGPGIPNGISYSGMSPHTSYSSSNGYFRRPTDAVYDSSGNIFATDLYNHRLQKFNSGFAYQSKVGSYSLTGFRYPYGMGIDSGNYVWVTDYYNHSVRKYDTSGGAPVQVSAIGGGAGTRIDAAKKVIKKIVSNTNLTSGANFGLMEWSVGSSSYTKIRVKISDTGAKSIFTDVDNVNANGWTTDLAYAMGKARDYFTSGQVSNWNKSCSLNYLIVISDGYWSKHSTVLSIADAIKNTYSIKTFAVGFALSGANSNYTTLAQKGGTVTPLYASNEAELLTKLTDAIKQAISGKLTFTTPAVMSDITKGNFVYQSTFEYEKNKQWEGHLKKYKLNTDGTFGAVQWNAADKLNNKAATARNLWTTGISDTSLNNFTTANRDELKSLLFPASTPTDAEVDNLINFIRGVDTYDEDSDNNKTESRHKLSDIYHSDLAIVGPPEGSTSDDGSANFKQKDAYYRLQNGYNNFKTGSSCGAACKYRKEVVLAGSNGGVLHAFDTSNGEELWGYIPPNITGKLSSMVSSKANATNAIYGVDGSPLVKDIYYDNSWKTIVLTGLGAGGHGYFALDITDINSPKHLFAIENDPFDQVIRHWDESGLRAEYGYLSGNVAATLDYRKLGEAWSTPRIIRIKIAGTEKWVAVFGAGYNGAVNTTYGSAVFVMDLEDEGRLLRKIDITDSASSDIVNSIPSDLTVITADGTEKATYSGAMIYASDLEGKVTKINLTDKGSLFQTTTLFNAEASTANGRYIYKKAEAAINNDNKLWLYFGTGNTQKLQSQSSNILNRVYGIKDKDFPNFVPVSPEGTVSQCKTSPKCPQTPDLGWYVDLKNAQKVTAEPTFDKDRIYFPIYEPTISTNACKTGTAILAGYDAKCGNTLLYVDLGTGVLSKVVVQGDNLYIGIAGTAKKGVKGFSAKDNLITGKSQATGGGKIQLEGWRQNR